MYDRTEMRESRRKRHRRKNSGGRLLAEYVGMILAVTAAILFLVQAVVINARIPSPSMEKTIMTGDQLFGNRLAYWRDGPERYDIIIFYFPDDESQRFIKRVIGLPGETVEIRSGKVYIDGSDHPLRDDFCPEPPTGDFGPYHVPEDSYFVLGDNREISKDSRYWKNPYVSRDEIIGEAMFRYWPLSRIGMLK